MTRGSLDNVPVCLHLQFTASLSEGEARNVRDMEVLFLNCDPVYVFWNMISIFRVTQFLLVGLGQVFVYLDLGVRNI